MRKLLFLGLGLGLCTCTPVVSDGIGTFMQDAGAALADAGSWVSDAGTAQAQPPIEVQCEPQGQYYLAFMPNTEGALASDLFGVEAIACHRTDASPGFGECHAWAAGLFNGRIAVNCGVDGSRWERVLFARR